MIGEAGSTGENYTLQNGGGLVTQTFSASNNQSTPQNITGFIFTKPFSAKVSVDIDATTKLSGLYTLEGIYNPSTGWVLSVDFSGDDTLITFSIDNTTGQVQYTTPSYAGFVSADINFQVQEI